MIMISPQIMFIWISSFVINVMILVPTVTKKSVVVFLRGIKKSLTCCHFIIAISQGQFFYSGYIFMKGHGDWETNIKKI